MFRTLIGLAAFVAVAYVIADKDELRRLRAQRHWWEPVLGVAAVAIWCVLLLT